MTGPFQPGTDPVRYETLPETDPDSVLLRSEMQEGAPGLYVMWCPVRRLRVLVEAYEPWELPEQYREPVEAWLPTDAGGERLVLTKQLNPWQAEDVRLGRLTAIAEVGVLDPEPNEYERQAIAGRLSPARLSEMNDRTNLPVLAALREGLGLAWVCSAGARLSMPVIRGLRGGNRAANSDFKYGAPAACHREAELRHKVLDKRREESDAILREAAESVGEYFATGLFPGHVVPA